MSGVQKAVKNLFMVELYRLDDCGRHAVFVIYLRDTLIRNREVP